jgi:single-strand DNA-binding protein
MMNKTMLQGNITKDLELKVLTSGTNSLSFTIAVSRDYVKEGEQRQSDFINCISFGNTAVHISKYFSKGSQILVEGSIQTRNYDDKDGKKVYVTEVKVDKAYFVGSKGGQATSENTEVTEDNNYGAVDDEEFVPVDTLEGDFLPF